MCSKASQLKAQTHQCVTSSLTIIELCRALPNYVSDWRLVTKMRACMQKDYCTCWTKNISIDEMWLLYYMKEAFNKKWVQARKDWI